MNKEMLDLCAWVVKTAKAAGADGCVVNLDDSRSVEISYRDRKPENIKEASTQALNIQVFVDGRYSVQSTSDLRKEALRDFMANAVAATRLLAEDPYRTPARPEVLPGQEQRPTSGSSTPPTPASPRRTATTWPRPWRTPACRPGATR